LRRHEEETLWCDEEEASSWGEKDEEEASFLLGTAARGSTLTVVEPL
jgi:hypothetical protein